VLAELDALLWRWTIFCLRCGPGRRPRITDAELITLAIAQIFLDCPSERRFLRLAARGLETCSRR
jgi:hypothetical protein